MRVRSTLGLVFLMVTGCFEAPGCSLTFDECDNDFDCGSSDICVFDGLSTSCEYRRPCSEGCQDGEFCDTRPGLSAENPFESDTPGKQVCECATGDCNGWGGNGGSAGWGGDGGSGGYGGSGGSSGSGGSEPCDLPAPTGDVVQTLQLGAAESDGGAMLASGGSVFAVPFRGVLSGGGVGTSAGETDLLIVGYESLTELPWWRTLGNEGTNVPTALAAEGALMAVATSFQGTIDAGTGPIDSGAGTSALIVGMGAAGATQWVLPLRSDGDVTVSGLAFDPADDRMIVSGTFSGLLDLGGPTLKSDGGTDGFVIAFDLATLGVQWSHVIGGAGDQHVAAMTGDKYGNVFLAGGFEGELSVDGAAPVAADAIDAFVLRISDAGYNSWSRVIGGPDRQVATAVTLSTYGLVVAGARGSTSPSAGHVDFGDGVVIPGFGLVDGYVATLGADGSLVWAQLFSGPQDSGEITPRAVRADCNGAIVLAGSATDGAQFGEAPLAGHGKHDAFLHKMDGDGKAVWSQLFGGPEEDSAVSLWIDEGAILVGGSFAGNAVFGATALQSAGADDAFLLEVAP